MKPDKRGRPRSLTGPGVRVSAWIPLHDFDALTRLAAHRADGSISGVLRDLAHKATTEKLPPNK